MFKSILAPITGTASDDAALETAYLMARLFDAHLHCVHVAMGPENTPPPGSLRTWPAAVERSKTGLPPAVDPRELRRAASTGMFSALCSGHRLPVATTPGPTVVSASFTHVSPGARAAIAHEAVFYDLVVMGKHAKDGFSVDEIGEIILQAGRPVLLSPAKAPENIGSCTAIAWKNTPASARAVAAAMPLIGRSSKVLILHTAGNGAELDRSAERLAEGLAWHGLPADVHNVAADGRLPAEAVMTEAQSRGADTLVMGGYGHLRTRERLFGGFTRHAVESCRMPVLLFH